MAITEYIEKIANEEGLDKERLMLFNLIAYLNEKKKKYVGERLEILKRYNVSSAKDLEKKIKKGEIKEHPAWEDLITMGNLERILTEISNDIQSLQQDL